MSRTGGRWGTLLGLALAGAGFVAGAFLVLREHPPERIVLIVVDTLRRDRLSPYGGTLETPNIQALADRGEVFTGVLASFHQTSMSMGALFTGRTPSIESRDPRQTLFWSGMSWCGLARLARAGEAPACIPAGVPTLAQRLAEAGYWTIGVASNRFLYEPFGYSAGFDDWVEVGRDSKRRIPTRSFVIPGTHQQDEWQLVRWHHVNRAVAAALGRRQSDRFFLYVHYMDVHDYAFEKRSYDASVEIVDQAVGRLLDGLEAAGLLEGTVIALTSDHGERLEERRPLPSGLQHLGNPSFQEVLEIPLIIAPPVDAQPDRFLRTQDLHHLILEIAGASAEPASDLAPDELFVGEKGFRTYLRGRWKSMQRRRDGEIFLFDLQEDRGEKRDVADAHPEVVESHRRRVDELGARLRSFGTLRKELTPLERERLEALGYLEPQS